MLSQGAARPQQDSKLHMYEVAGDDLKETGSVTTKGQVHAVAFSPDSSMVACGDSGRNVLVYSVPALEVLFPCCCKLFIPCTYMLDIYIYTHTTQIHIDRNAFDCIFTYM